jgi:hypothetical protein
MHVPRKRHRHFALFIKRCACGCTKCSAEDPVDVAHDMLLPNVADGLSACGIDDAFTRITRKQEECAQRMAGAQLCPPCTCRL